MPTLETRHVMLQPEDRDVSRRRTALLIGISMYSSISSLPQMVVKDAFDLQQLFLDESHYHQVEILTDREATRNGILSSVSKLSFGLAAEDIFLLYFSGHGTRFHDHSYLLPEDARLDRSDLAIESAISLDEIFSLLPQINTTIFITDACHQEGPLTGFSFPLNMPENVAGFASSRPNEMSFVLPNMPNSVYTYYLLEGLRGAADRERKGAVSVFDLHRYVARKVQDHTEARQTPMLSYRGIEDTAIVQYSVGQSEINERKRMEESDRLQAEMMSCAEAEDWLSILDRWDRLLKLAIRSNQVFPIVIQARQKIDENIIPYAGESPDLILSYPRVWPCLQERPIIYPHALLTHPDVKKGDILLQYEQEGSVSKILTVFTAGTNAFPCNNNKGEVHYYVIAGDKLDISHPVFATLAKLQRAIKNSQLAPVVQEWSRFESWARDLRTIGLWDDFRYELFKEHTNQASSLLEIELVPLTYGVGMNPEDALLREAIDHLFEEYKKLAKIPKSRLKQQYLEDQKAELWKRARSQRESTPDSVSKDEVTNKKPLPQSEASLPDSATSIAPSEVAPVADAFLKIEKGWVDRVTPGECLEIQIFVENRSRRVWRPSSSAPDLEPTPDSMNICYRVTQTQKPTEPVTYAKQPITRQVTPGQSTTVDTTFTAPEQPGPYRVLWTVERTGDHKGIADVDLNTSLIKDVEVLDVQDTLKRLPDGLSSNLTERLDQIKAIRAIAARPISEEVRIQLIDQGLIPSLYHDDRSVVRAALEALYALSNHTVVADHVRHSLAQRPGAFEQVRQLAQQMSVGKQIRKWFDSMRPAQTLITSAVSERPNIDSDVPSEENRRSGELAISTLAALGAEGVIPQPVSQTITSPVAQPSSTAEPQNSIGTPAHAEQESIQQFATSSHTANEESQASEAALPNEQNVAPDTTASGRAESETAPITAIASESADVPAERFPTTPTPKPAPAGARELQRTLPEAVGGATDPSAIREVVWQRVVQSVERDLDTQDTHTLDIHIGPRFVDTTLARVLDEATADSARQYTVVMQLVEEENHQKQREIYEGRLHLEAFEKFRARQIGDRRYGSALHQAVFYAEVLDAADRYTTSSATLVDGYRVALDRARGDMLRVQLRLNNDAPELHEYQWEYLWDELRQQPMACDPSTPFARVLHVNGPRQNKPPHNIDAQHPLRVLLAVANPSNLGDPNDPELSRLASIAPEEITRLRAGFTKIGPAIDHTELVSPAVVSLEALRQQLADAPLNQPFHVLHLVCHGLIDANGRSCIVLHRHNSDQAELVPEDQFVAIVNQVGAALRLIVLASCYTALPTAAKPLGGIARSLVSKAQVPAVIAMQQQLEFTAAQYFSQRLYQQLLQHGEIDRAVNAIRAELFTRTITTNELHTQQWGVPVLFMQLIDGRLFNVSPDVGQQVANFKPEVMDFDQVPGSDRRRLADGLLRSFAGSSSTPLGVTPADLIAALRAYETARATLPDRSEPAQPPQLFAGAALQSQRWRLIQAASEYRRHESSRRTVLCLRGLACEHIEQLVAADRLGQLTSAQFVEAIWSGGHVEWDARRSFEILDSGPLGQYLLDETATAIDVTSNDWRQALRIDSSKFVGNLTWSTAGRADPDHTPAELRQLRDLLYGRGDVFELFKSLSTQYAARGLDERTLSLLLHAVRPDRYLPYHRDLARDALRELDLSTDARYNTGYVGYCALAETLLADADLGFESLADVGYFLQRLADPLRRPKLNDQSTADAPDDLQVRLQTVNLKPGGVDTGLAVWQGTLDQLAAALNAGKHIILIGPPGTGKTTLAEDVCRHAHDLDCNRGHVMVTATADWTTFDTIGGYMPDQNGRLAFRPGIFLDAIAARQWLIIDEINRADIDKAFGELFSVLSGQAVVLPYKLNNQPVRILPPAHATSAVFHDYMIHPSWRIIGTMNVYDKASLFAMSYAFMRRFAFIDVPVPEPPEYKDLLDTFIARMRVSFAATELVRLKELFDRSAASNHLMQWRALGPAIAWDIVRYLAHRADHGQVTLAHLAEALLLYVVPQLDGLDQEKVRTIYDDYKAQFGDVSCAAEREALLARIRDLFPFVTFE